MLAEIEGLLAESGGPADHSSGESIQQAERADKLESYKSTYGVSKGSVSFSKLVKRHCNRGANDPQGRQELATLVDEAAIRRYIDALIEGDRDHEEALRSAQRWPWKKNQAPQILYALAQTKVVIGINWCTVGESDRARAAFVDAIRSATERFTQVPRVFLGYHDVQIVSAGVLAGDEGTASAAVRAALRVSQDTNDNPAVQIPNAAARALFGWVLNDPSAVTEPAGTAKTAHFEQFHLWHDIAHAAMGRDVDRVREAFGSLVKLVATEIRREEFRYSEDSLSYLPGQLIARLAARGPARIAQRARGVPHSRRGIRGRRYARRRRGSRTGNEPGRPGNGGG